MMQSTGSIGVGDAGQVLDYTEPPQWCRVYRHVGGNIYEVYRLAENLGEPAVGMYWEEGGEPFSLRRAAEISGRPDVPVGQIVLTYRAAVEVGWVFQWVGVSGPYDVLESVGSGGVYELSGRVSCGGPYPDVAWCSVYYYLDTVAVTVGQVLYRRALVGTYTFGFGLAVGDGAYHWRRDCEYPLPGAGEYLADVVPGSMGRPTTDDWRDWLRWSFGHPVRNERDVEAVGHLLQGDLLCGVPVLMYYQTTPTEDDGELAYGQPCYVPVRGSVGEIHTRVADVRRDATGYYIVVLEHWHVCAAALQTLTERRRRDTEDLGLDVLTGVCLDRVPQGVLLGLSRQTGWPSGETALPQVIRVGAGLELVDGELRLAGASGPRGTYSYEPYRLRGRSARVYAQTVGWECEPVVTDCCGDSGGSGGDGGSGSDGGSGGSGGLACSRELPSGICMQWDAQEPESTMYQPGGPCFARFNVFLTRDASGELVGSVQYPPPGYAGWLVSRGFTPEAALQFTQLCPSAPVEVRVRCAGRPDSGEVLFITAQASRSDGLMLYSGGGMVDWPPGPLSGQMFTGLHRVGAPGVVDLSLNDVAVRFVDGPCDERVGPDVEAPGSGGGSGGSGGTGGGYDGGSGGSGGSGGDDGSGGSGGDDGGGGGGGGVGNCSPAASPCDPSSPPPVLRVEFFEHTAPPVFPSPIVWLAPTLIHSFYDYRHDFTCGGEDYRLLVVVNPFANYVAVLLIHQTSSTIIYQSGELNCAVHFNAATNYAHVLDFALPSGYCYQGNVRLRLQFFAGSSSGTPWPPCISDFPPPPPPPGGPGGPGDGGPGDGGPGGPGDGGGGWIGNTERRLNYTVTGCPQVASRWEGIPTLPLGPGQHMAGLVLPFCGSATVQLLLQPVPTGVQAVVIAGTQTIHDQVYPHPFNGVVTWTMPNQAGMCCAGQTITVAVEDAGPWAAACELLANPNRPMRLTLTSPCGAWAGVQVVTPFLFNGKYTWQYIFACAGVDYIATVEYDMGAGAVGIQVDALDGAIVDFGLLRPCRAFFGGSYTLGLTLLEPTNCCVGQVVRLTFELL